MREECLPEDYDETLMQGRGGPGIGKSFIGIFLLSLMFCKREIKKG